MIININKFIKEEEKYWRELEVILDKIEDDHFFKMNLEEIKNFHYLYQRVSNDLIKIRTFVSEQDVRNYLESLVARSFGIVHEARKDLKVPSFKSWFFYSFPRTFRKHIFCFWMSVVIMMSGFLFGGLAVSFDNDAKEIIMPFSNLMKSPNERVAAEESKAVDNMENVKARFSASLMTHNIRVSILTFGTGIIYGIFTIILIFYNGIILGGVSLDYILAGEAKFLAGWLFPHGAVEIPAFLLAGQTGLILAGAVIGWGTSKSLKTRLREISNDLVTLILGIAVLLIWAGFVEAFLSQYHEPVLPYFIKIIFGIIELILLVIFFYYSGRIDINMEKQKDGKT